MIINPDFTKRYEKIPVNIFEEADKASRLVAEKITAIINEKEELNKPCVLALSASSATIPVYESLVSLYKEKKMSFKNVHIFSLDEYWPLNKNELQSHYRFLKEYLLDFIDIPQANLNFLDSEVEKEIIHEYCENYENKIASLGGIDALVAQSRQSEQMDSIRWESLENRYQYYENYDNSVKSLKHFIEKRRDFLSDVWLEGAVYHNVTFVVDGEPWKIACVKDGELVGSEPIPHKENAFFVKWLSEKRNVAYDEFKPVYEDVTFYALWQELHFV